jgi:hypothetical protein
MKKIVSGVMAVAMLSCGALTATAGAEQPIEPVTSGFIGFEPTASEHLSSWSPLLSRTAYGAQVTFVGSRSGSIEVELQNSSGNRITGFTETFTNRSSIAYTRNRNTATGTYRIRITVTINGSSTTRTSHYMTI